MGRVRKYKKVKAMDPFAKGGGGGRMGMGRKGGSDLDRNLPPDVKNHQAQRLNNLEGGAYCTRSLPVLFVSGGCAPYEVDPDAGGGGV